MKREDPVSYENLMKKLKIKPGRVIEKSGAAGAAVEDEELEIDVTVPLEEHASSK